MATSLISSETSVCRGDVERYCKGTGLDLGSGGDPIVPWAIQFDLREPYQRSGDLPIHIRGDASDLSQFSDGALDFVYSSHLLEDFEDWQEVVREWARVVKAGGYLVLLVPDHERFRKAVREGQGDNLAHKHEFTIGELSEAVKDIYPAWYVIRESHYSPDSYTIVFVARRLP